MVAMKKDKQDSSSSFIVVVFAHIVAVVVTVLVLVWLLHFREGLAFRTHIKPKIFNIHPLLMIIGFILFGGEAILAYKTLPGARKVHKRIHLTLHVVALLSGIIGIYAVFKFHHEQGIPQVYTLHSWLGLVTISLYGLQWVISVFTFASGKTNSTTREKIAPWHVLAGIIVFMLAICTALMGLTEKFIYLKMKRGQEALVMNVTGLLIVLFAVTVGVGVMLPRMN